MRNPDRIDEMLELVKEIWLRDPDLRFNQLLYNLQHDYSTRNNGIGKVQEVDSEGFAQIGFDLFNLEDDAFLEFLRTQTSK